MLGNFGIPTALTTIATNALNKEDVTEVFKKSLKIMISVVSVLLILIAFLFFSNVVPFEFFFGKTEKTQFYASILLLTIVFYLIRAPFQLASSVFLIFGKISLNKTYEILNNLIIPFSFLITYLCSGNISLYAGIWSLLLVFSSIIMFFHSRIYLQKNRDEGTDPKSSTITYTQIIKISFGYFIVSMGALLVWNTDNFVIVNFLGVNEVTAYSLTFRIFTAFFSLLLTLNAILLPFYGRYNSDNNYNSIQVKFRNSILLMTLLSGPLCIFIFLFSKEIFITWTNNPSLYLGSNIFLAFGLYTFVLSCLSSISTLLSALKRVRLLIVGTFVEGITNLILSIFFIRKLGILGVSLGTLLGSVLSLLVVCVFFKRDIQIPVKIPIGLIIRNMAVIIATSGILLLVNITTVTLFYKLVVFSIFAILYLLVNIKDISPMLHLKNKTHV
ncbi:MATE family efflux transporter [Pedobacter hiemivivus]